MNLRVSPHERFAPQPESDFESDYSTTIGEDFNAVNDADFTAPPALPVGTRWLPFSTSGFRGFGEYSAELDSMYWRR